jgi:GT2 family glycosyltransferase
MITVIYSTHKDENYNKKFKQHLIDSSGLKDVEILEYVNHNQYGLSQVYNSGITDSIYDIVVCCHNDIKLEKNWGKKLIKDFNDNPEYGIIGKAGSSFFPKSGIYWENMRVSMVGQVYHHPEGSKKWLSKYSPKQPNLIPVVTIDGLFMSFNKNKIKHMFNESIGRFHFYDHPFCLDNFLDNVKIGVTSSFEITHQSVGKPNKEFFESRDKFLEKYSSNLPLDLKPKNIHIPSIVEKPIKVGKVAIVIPTKNKFELLNQCVTSIFEHSNPSLFDIIIADTGSSLTNKDKLFELSKKYNNVKIVEYDYYNFAKINNDVVKNHTNNEHEFLLFCNNDVKLLNNVIYGMLKIFKTKNNVGTVGCRLHFEDNTIQHDGVLFYVDSKTKNQLFITHKNIGNYYNYSLGINEVVGSTAALLMIRKNVFLKCGGFNENYITCFEDVELNLKCLLLGLVNYCDSNLVAYHYESQTRQDDTEDSKKQSFDYTERIIPFVNQNLNKIKKYIQLI